MCSWAIVNGGFVEARAVGWIDVREGELKPPIDARRALRARIGTINLLCHGDVPLTDEALLEAMSIATEARTVSIRDAAVPSLRSGLRAIGTGTDCIVMATPVAGHHQAYAGKHTRIGHVVGAAVAEAVRRGAAEWKAARGTA
jgi:adenosylcobinamide amidohydrolase